MFQPRRHKNEIAGFEGRSGDCLVFFGTRHCDRARLAELYPGLKFSFLSQVHGNDIVEAKPELSPKADGLYTGERSHALVIQTADCLPVLLAGREKVIALHAGWRGLAKRIISCASRLGEFEWAAIGPHIRKESFEVGMDVARELEPIAGSGAILQHPNPDKRFIDLSFIARKQLLEHFGPDFPVKIMEGDTKVSPLYHSYRRGKDRAGRQFSFIARI